MQIPSLGCKQTFALFACALFVLGVVIWLAARFISPAPPGKIDMTAGAVGGASHQLALEYQAWFKPNGVELRLLPSTGSVQNLERLNAGTPAGFVQSGLDTLALDAQKVARAWAQLEQIEHDVSSMKFPLDFSDRVYTLRQHVDYVRGHLHTYNPDTVE